MVDLPPRDLFRTVSPLQLGYWVIPGSPILTSTNERKPLYRYRWSWTSVRVTGETIGSLSNDDGNGNDNAAKQQV